MALAKERSYYAESPNASSSLLGLLGLEGENDSASGVLKNFSINRLPALTDSCNDNGIMFGDLISFKAGSPMLDFERREDLFGNSRASKVARNVDDSNTNWRNAMDHSYTWNQVTQNLPSSDQSRLPEDRNCFETSSSSGGRVVKDNQLVDEAMGWLYTDGGDGMEESTSPETNSNKRLHMGTEMECRKKQRVLDSSRKAKAKIIPSKDPQSIAAKNRRERISERLKVLQDLVPNGSKVDLVTMLEKAISYVKFLQLQVKVLATDEFWPAQGGKAPEISQVKEAIDAILSSQKDRTSSSN
ncbi:hypothetical protein ACHQM5_009723 [Ranunculus cassubicifolius]